MGLFTLNLLLALMWMFLGGAPSLASLATGFALGFALLALLRPVFPDSSYVRRALALLRFAALFLREFIRSNLTVARAVLFRPRDSLRPDFLSYDVTGLTRTEILLLAYAITLTPGSTAVEVSEDGRALTLHVFDIDDADAVRAGIDRHLKQPLLRITR
jgi:multisubunit Na+/H+ antiporter MnhE subunit